MSFYAEMERILKEEGERGLEHLEYYWGLRLDLMREAKRNDAYTRVHGRNAGGPVEKVDEFTGVLEGDDFLPSNDQYSGAFETGFLYTKYEGILVGDIIKIQSEDLKSRRFKVVERQQIGLSTEVFTKWKLSSIGD